MKSVLLATYKRPDTYNGYSKINHYHVPTEFRCYRIDQSEERSLGIRINGILAPDYYELTEVNYKGEITYRHTFANKNEANKYFLDMLNSFPDFRKC